MQQHTGCPGICVACIGRSESLTATGPLGGPGLGGEEAGGAEEEEDEEDVDCWLLLVDA